MMRTSLLFSLVVALLVTPVCGWAQIRISCGESQSTSSIFGHQGLALFTFEAQKNAHYSFMVESGDANVVTFVGRPPELLQGPISNEPVTWLCDWVAWDDGDFQVILDVSAAAGGWEVSLTLHCVVPPEDCTGVAIAPKSWTNVKRLFR